VSRKEDLVVKVLIRKEKIEMSMKENKIKFLNMMLMKWKMKKAEEKVLILK
jgi:hypothetical protein